MRLFTCKACNYKNRFGRSTCSYCFAPTRLLNRVWFLPLVLGLVGAAVYILQRV